MKKVPFTFLIGFSVLTATVFTQASAQQQSSPSDSNPVRADLIANVDSAVLEQEYSLGVMFKMSAGWHIYWSYPGNTGKPTRVSFQSDPSHTKVLEPGFPAPRVFDPKPIDGLSFGYANQALILAEAMTYDRPSRGLVEIRAQASWLACKEVCIPGKAELSLQLPVGNTAKESKWSDLFRHTLSRLPKETEQTGGHIESLRYHDGKLEILFALQGFKSVQQFIPRWLSGSTCKILSYGTESTDDNRKLARLSLSGFNCFPGAGGIVLGQSTEAKHASSSAFVVDARPVTLPAHQPQSTVKQADTTLAPGTSGFLKSDRQSTGWMLLLAFLGGMLLNVMPCVIPVVVPKLLHLVRTIRGKEDQRQKSRLLWLNSLAYTAGVLATMLGLAVVVVVLKIFGHEVGWGFQFQSPWFLVFMISLLVVAGLGMLKTFSLKSSQHTDNLKQLRKLRHSSPLLESFFTGLLVTFLGTPCTAPFLGPALGYAFTTSNLQIGLFLLVIGLGLSSPFLVLGVWTGWTRILPSRVTERYDRIMRIMSFLLFGTAIWLLGVLAQGHGMDALMNMLWFLLVLALAAWFFGLWAHEQQPPKKRVLILIPLLAAVIGFGAWVLEFPDQAKAAGSSRLNSPVGIEWQPFSDKKVSELRASGKTVFIDFTAEWCLNCKANERLFIETQATKKLFDRLKIAAIKADHTRFDPTIQSWLKRFGRAGVPMYLVFPACKNDKQVILLPEILTPGLLHQALKKAGPSLASCS